MTNAQRKAEYQFDFTGGKLCLDFANTASLRSFPNERREHLSGYEDLLVFARQAKLISSQEWEVLRNQARSNPSEAARLFRRALNLREALFRIFVLVSAEKAAAPEDIAQINELAVEAFKHRQLARSNGGYAWQWTAQQNARIEKVLWLITQSATELLTSDELSKVRECEAADCEWLFLDVSRNHSRRWCDMKSCGNREKARRHYQRERT